jgi:uncharacterized protein YndB with AHSA1/START domain
VPSATSLVEHEVRVAASPETVFSFFTDPAKMVQWMGVEATLDPRPGGVCRIDVVGESPLMGEFVEVEPFSRVVFTWGWEEEHFGMPPQSSAVEVMLVPDGEETIVRLIHRRLPEAAVDFHTRGWHHYLARLAVVAAGGDPGSDPWRRDRTSA